MGMIGNRLESLECPYDCDGDFPGILQTSYEELPGIAKKQSCGSGSPICKLFYCLKIKILSSLF